MEIHKDGCEVKNNAGMGHTFMPNCEKYNPTANFGVAPTQPEREEKIRKGAKDFANRFEGVMKELVKEEQPESKGWDKIIELVDKQRVEMYELGKKHGKLLVLAEIQEKLPQPEKAHTYASENADIYRHQDEGQEMYRQQVLDLLTGMRKEI